MKKALRLTASIVRDSMPPVPEHFHDQAERMLARLPAKEVVPMKKKLSVGLVLTITLCLIAVGALAAALLSVPEVVEQELIPIAQESASDYFTPEEVERVLNILEQNDLRLDQATLEGILKEDNASKYAVLMKVFTLEFGKATAAEWTPEQRAVASRILFDAGLIEKNRHLPPPEDALSLRQAVQSANDYVRETYQTQEDFFDESRYVVWNNYYRKPDGEASPDRAEWWLWFHPLTEEDNAYTMELNAQGDILSCEVQYAPCKWSPLDGASSAE